VLVLVVRPPIPRTPASSHTRLSASVCWELLVRSCVMGCASSSAADNEGHAPGSSRRGSARTESVPEEPWESTVKSGEGA